MLPPPEIILTVMRYLDVKDLLSYGLTNKYTWALHQDHSLWKRVSDVYCFDSQSKQEFIHFFQKYRSWMQIYPRMKNAIKYIELT
jgi:hypothetical protein